MCLIYTNKPFFNDQMSCITACYYGNQSEPHRFILAIKSWFYLPDFYDQTDII